jgi:hypothetical protein
MPAELKRSPYLMSLIESRARAAAQVERVREALKVRGKEFAQTRRQLREYDESIMAYNPELDPTLIKSVHGWRTGEYGRLGEAIQAAFEAHPGQWLSPREVTTFVARELCLVFISRADRRAWSTGSIGRRLQKLTAKGRLEKMPVKEAAKRFSGVGARWRLSSDSAPSRVRLISQAAAAGGSVRVPDAGRE